MNGACRPLARTNLVSPCDGKVLTIGRVKDGFLEQIKGQAFTVDQFLGPKIDQSEDEIFSYRSDDRDNRQTFEIDSDWLVLTAHQSLLKSLAKTALLFVIIKRSRGERTILFSYLFGSRRLSSISFPMRFQSHFQTSFPRKIFKR